MSLTAATDPVALPPIVHRGSTSTHPAPAPTSGCVGLAIRHVLVPLDGSALAERAVPYAVAVAKASSAHLTLLRVLEPAGGATVTVDALDWEILRREAAAYLAKIQSEIAATGIDTSVEIVQGKASEQVLHVAAARDADLIVLSTHGEGGIGQWNLSSTAHKVSTISPTSLLIVPSRAVDEQTPFDFRFRKVLVALDCSPRAECVLPTATEIARAHGAEIILANVIPDPELPRRVSPSAQDVELAQQLTERNRREAVRYLRELQTRLAGAAARVTVRTVVSARFAQALRDLAQHEGADLLMISAHGITGDAAVSYGTVASRLLEHTTLPVIVMQDLASGARESRAGTAAAQR